VAFRYFRGDVRSLKLVDIFKGHRVTALIHLIFISKPTHNEVVATDTAVQVTRHVFESAAAAGVEHAILVSSVAVYGPGPHARRLVESDTPKPSGFQFSRLKVLQERAAEHVANARGMSLTMVRPCSVVGTSATNFLLKCFMRRIAPLPAGIDPDWQFLHEEDFCSSILAILRSRATGVYNLAPDDTLRLRQALEMLGTRPIDLPHQVLKAAVSLAWATRLGSLAPAPTSALQFLADPPLVSNTAIRHRLGYEFAHSSASALRALSGGRDGCRSLGV